MVRDLSCSWHWTTTIRMLVYTARSRQSPGFGSRSRWFERNKNVSSPSTCKKTQYCGEPPWPRGSVLGLRPPRLEFRILSLEYNVISFISPSSGGSPSPVQPIFAQMWPKARFILFLTPPSKHLGYKRHSSNAVSMLAQRRRRWPSIETVLSECFVFAGRWLHAVIRSSHLPRKHEVELVSVSMQIQSCYYVFIIFCLHSLFMWKARQAVHGGYTFFARAKQTLTFNQCCFNVGPASQSLFVGYMASGSGYRGGVGDEILLH